MAPQALPQDFGDASWTPSEGGNFTAIDPGIYPLFIFDAQPKKSSKGKPGFDITFRVDGTAFDGEDVHERFAGLTTDTIFRTHDILKAAGVLDTYYHRNPNPEQKGGTWVAVPTKEDLIGLKLQGRIENEPWQGSDKDSGVPQYNEDGTPKMLNSNRITGYYPSGENVEFKSTNIKPRYAAGVDPTQPFGGGAHGGFGSGGAGGTTDPWGGAQPQQQQAGAVQQQGYQPPQQPGQPGPSTPGW